jgi:alpha-galactosidase
MIARISHGIAIPLSLLVTAWAHAVSPTPAEMADARAWAMAKFEGTQNTKAPDVGLFVVANHDAVQLNGRHDKPLRMGGKYYTHGVFCHAPSKLIVRLPSAGKTLTATAGVDTNEQTNSGLGSVIFSMGVGETNVFKSELMREGMPGAAVQVDLQGAKEFVLEVGDGGDGIACDQADWADAKVLLADGQTVWLGDLPIYGANYQPCGLGPFFSFTYDGKPSSELLKTWKLERSSRTLDERRTERTLIYTDPKAGLAVRCVGVEYRDFPTVEWTLYFKNTGAADTPILADIQAIDAGFTASGSGEFTLHYTKGDDCVPDSFEPLAEKLGPKATKQLSPKGGRPTSRANPYWNLHNQGNGLIVVLGWPGQWAARFDRGEGNVLRIRGGQERTHFKLGPGEEARTPLVALQFYRGDWLRGQNIWRRWMIAHNMPRPGGKLPTVQHAACSSHQFAEMCNATTKDQIYFIDRYIEEGMTPDYWWMDAGWYPCDQIGWWKTGTWEVDTRRFPRGLREVSDHAHNKDVGIIVWHEPERVLRDTWLTENHPEWILGGKNGGLLNLGNPDAWKWATQHFNKLIDEQGIDLYRQDFNFDPLDSWRSADAPDRQGITEIKHVTGYLAYWDDLLARHPGLLIDSCASGGRRNDIETLRRGVPLYRSDYILEPVGNQGHTYGISLWIPYYGTGGKAADLYLLRSVMAPAFVTLFDMRMKDLDYDLLRGAIRQWRQFIPNYLGDYYPLSPYSIDSENWIAWQFNRPEVGEGVVQAFRRADSMYESIHARLQGLDPDAVYTLTSLDIDGKTQRTGSELMQEGLSIPIKEQPGSAVIIYKKNG